MTAMLENGELYKARIVQLTRVRTILFREPTKGRQAHDRA